MELIKVR